MTHPVLSKNIPLCENEIQQAMSYKYLGHKIPTRKMTRPVKF